MNGTTITIGTRVSLKDTYADPGEQKPVTGTVEDILNYDAVDRYVVMFDEETMTTAKENGLLAPPGGEFSRDRLELSTYAHLLPQSDEQAAERVAALLA
jgi:hypothetical protein